MLDVDRQALPPHAKIVLEHAGVSPQSPATETEQLANIVAWLDPDAMLIVGGGKVSGTAKGVPILLACGDHLLVDHCAAFVPPADYRAPTGVNACIPGIAIPTTLSGTELTPGGGARTAADVEVPCRTPCHILGGTGMNALAHFVEGVRSRTSLPYSDALAHSAARDLVSAIYLLAADADVDELLFQLGSALTGLVIGTAGTGLHHAICHVFRAVLGVAHSFRPIKIRYDN